MLPSLSLLQPKFLTWVTVAAFVALSAITVKLKIDKDGLTLEVQKAKTELASVRQKSAEHVAQVTQDFRQREAGLNQKIATQKETADETIASLRSRADALVVSLRNAKRERDSAPAVPTASAVAPDVQAVAGGDGPLVPAEIGEPDVAEALRADTIRVELLRCYAQYDAAAEALALPLPEPQVK